MELSDRDIDALPVAKAPAARIPLIDLAGDASRVSGEIADACRDWGLFLLTGHGIPAELTGRCFARMRHFFARPREEKQRLTRSLENPWGFYDRELTKNLRDAKEVFDIGPESGGAGDPFSGETPWPGDDPEFGATMRATMAACEALAARLVGLAIAGLGEEPVLVARAFRPAPTSFLRLNHYPVTEPASTRSVHHHSDAGALTILFEDGTPGLQVLRDGLWHDVAPVPGALIVNTGDMLEVWSNGRYRAPVHRVLAMTQRARFSAPFFYNPSYEATIAPLPGLAARDGAVRFHPIRWAEFRRLRALGDYGDHGREVQIGDYAV